jgi:PAS domain S-box-containing protein
LGDEIFRRLVEGAQDYAIFLLTPSGVIATWNAGAQRIKGYSASEAIGKHFSIFYTPDALETGWPAEELRRATAQGRLEDEGWRVRKDGTRFWANVIISPLFAGDGRLLGFSKITRDLTQRLRVESLEKEGHRISEFISMLSHELRNPLGSIRNAAALLKMHPPQDRVDWCVEIIDRQIVHLQRLIDDLLDMNRVASGKIHVERATIDFNHVVRQAVESASPAIEANGQTLALRLASSPAMVLGDATRLTQVVTNLLNNASKYTPDGGHITISTERTVAEVRLCVADNGIGMTESLLQQAFEPFVQGGRNAGRAQSGVGIGLALVKRIIELHQGEVGAFSAGEDQGTTMTVVLPLASV